MESVVIPFIINVSMEINFSSKIYSKSLLKELHEAKSIIFFKMVQFDFEEGNL